MQAVFDVADEVAAARVYEVDIVGEGSPSHPFLDDVEVRDVIADGAMPGCVQVVPVVGVVRTERAFRILGPSRQRRIVIALDHDSPTPFAANGIGERRCFLNLVLD